MTIITRENIAQFQNDTLNSALFLLTQGPEDRKEFDAAAQEVFGTDGDTLAAFLTWASAKGII